jgi:hypothetical protein
MGSSIGKKGLMPAVAEPKTKKKEDPAEKLARYRREISAKPRTKQEDSLAVSLHKLEVFDEWADLRERVTYIA